MKLLRIATMVALMASFLVPAAKAEQMRKVDSFDFLVDNTVSMDEDVVVETLTKINSMIPELGYKSSMHNFSGVVVPYGPWDKAGMDAAFTDADSGFGEELGDAIIATAPDLYAMEGPSAVVLFTDGESEKGVNPISEIRMLYEAAPDLCVHVVSFAESATAQAILDEIAGMKKCSVSVKAADLLASDEATAQFVQDVFYADGENVFVLRGVNYEFDSAELNVEAKIVLDELIPTLSNSEAITLEGWTDSKGSAAYNEKLSLRRAEAVAAYLVQMGIPAEKITSVGKGISYKFDNATLDGRYLNRRTEIKY